jgi:hypothetical protein
VPAITRKSSIAAGTSNVAVSSRSVPETRETESETSGVDSGAAVCAGRVPTPATPDDPAVGTDVAVEVSAVTASIADSNPGPGPTASRSVLVAVPDAVTAGSAAMAGPTAMDAATKQTRHKRSVTDARGPIASGFELME